MKIFVSDTALESLEEAAAELQARYLEDSGENISVEIIQSALTHWIEVSIEEIAEDAVELLVGGHDFQRSVFERKLERLLSDRQIPENPCPIAA